MTMAKRGGVVSILGCFWMIGCGSVGSSNHSDAGGAGGQGAGGHGTGGAIGAGGSGSGGAMTGTGGTGTGGHITGDGGVDGGAIVGTGGTIVDASASETSDAPAAACDPSKPFGAPTLVPVINTGFREMDIWLTGDELTAIFASDRTDLGGPGGYDLYRATRTSRTADFAAPLLLANLSSAQTDRKPVLSPDGLTLFFSSDRALSDGAATGQNIYISTRPNVLSDFGAPGTLAGANSSVGDVVNSITADGKVLYLDSSVGGNRDIYTKELASSAAPAALTQVNSPDDDAFAVISADSLTLYFGSARTAPNTPDAGVLDPWNIWVAHRTSPTGTFGTASPVAELNTLSLDFPNWISPDGCTIYLTSDRNAPSGTRHIWVATKPR